jgi:hypothetical protein
MAEKDFPNRTAAILDRTTRVKKERSYFEVYFRKNQFEIPASHFFCFQMRSSEERDLSTVNGAQGPGYEIGQFIEPVQQLAEQRIDGSVPCARAGPSIGK